MYRHKEGLLVNVRSIGLAAVPPFPSALAEVRWRADVCCPLITALRTAVRVLVRPFELPDTRFAIYYYTLPTIILSNLHFRC